YGPVEELLDAVDDRHVVMASGDELALEFDPSALPPLLPGFTRTWMIHGFGYVKDTDLNSPASGRVDPLPFRGMGTFPPPDAAYMEETARAKAVSRFNTRVIRPADPLQREPVRSAVAPGLPDR
ncbi:MAG: hypothetical protein ACE5ID_06695, partial [Acidobacteriota bacterium]